MNPRRDTSSVEFCSGIPTTFWNDIGQPDRTLILESGLGSVSSGLIQRLAEITKIPVYQALAHKAASIISRQIKVERANYISAYPLTLPFADNQFNLVVSYWSIHHSSDPRILLNEINRLLKPGGFLLIADGINKKGSPAQNLHLKFHRFSMAVDQAQSRPHIPLLGSNELEETVRESGFEDIHWQEIIKTDQTIHPAEVETFRREALRLLTDIYPQEIERIQRGKDRLQKQRKELTDELATAPLEIHPYLILQAKKKPFKRQVVRGNLSESSDPPQSISTYSSPVIAEKSGYSLKFRDIPDEFKPREKMIIHGPAALKNHELLAVLMVTGSTKENVIELSRRLITEYGSRAISQERRVRRLQDTLKIGTKKACQIVAAFELGRRFFEEPTGRFPTILGPDDAYEYLKDMAKLTREHFRGLYLNTRGRVIRDEIISIGSLNMSIVFPREVFLPAVEFSAAAIILAHNHPSGDPTPSEEDLRITQQMVEAGKVMGIEVFDHIIIAEDRFVSLQREKKLG